MPGTWRDGIQVDQRRYDAAGRALLSGPPTSRPGGWADALNQNVALEQVIGKETRLSVFDAEGRLQQQRTLHADASQKTDLDYRGGHDAAGNVLRYHVADWVNGAGNDYRRTLTRFESYREVRV